MLDASLEKASASCPGDNDLKDRTFPQHVDVSNPHRILVFELILRNKVKCLHSSNATNIAHELDLQCQSE